ncbi:MAG: DUF4115 domain-containing protein [Candidatus Omnitrophica bacterium]|nr:DUF4115 domain-containing protein [Candidatus Omnitrophota bacterium]
MTTVGGRLQDARAEQKLSLADVTRETKIQPWVLEALESDRLQDLMSPIYVKGFVTTYAKFLHLDPAPLIAQLRWPPPEVAQQPLPPVSPLVVTWPRPLHRRLVVAAAIGAVTVGLLIVGPLRRFSMPPLLRPGAPQLASVGSVNEPTRPPELPTLTLLSTQPLELLVSAQRTTWIQVRADGKLLTQQRLERGAKERWTAKKQFELIVSRPSQVDLVLNGQPISPFAIAHQGRLLITHHGITKLPAKKP